MSKKPSNVALPPVKAKSNNNKVRPQKERKRPPSLIEAQKAGGASTKPVTVVKCLINPYILTEFLFGYYSRGLSDADSLFDPSLISSLVYNTLSFLSYSDITQAGIKSMPREIVDLYWSLQTRQYKDFLFEADFTFCNQFVYNLSNNSWTAATGLIDCVYPTSANSSTPGFYNCDIKVITFAPTQFRDAWAQAGSAFTMVDIMDKSRASIDAFCFDVKTPVLASSFQTNIVAPYAYVGNATGGSNFYMAQDSFVGLEVKPPAFTWMGSLRLCTYTGVPLNGVGVAIDQTRLPFWSARVNSFPSVIGHQLGSNKGEYRGVVQLKICPMTAALTDIISRLEAIASAAGKLTNWLADFSASDIRLLAMGLWRAANSRYAASSYGIYVFSGTTGNKAETYFDNAGYKLFQSIRIPQVINDCLQAQKVYSDKRGVLLPCYTRTGSLQALPVTSNYTGTGVTVIPDDGAAASWRYFANAMDIITKYKKYENAFAGVSKLTLVTSYGNSLLDCTITRDTTSTGTSTGNAIMVSSRRPLVTPFLMSVLMKTAYVSYDYSAPSIIPFTIAVGAEDRTKVYSQPFTTPLSGTDAITKLIACSVADGLVPLGAEADNASPFTGGDYNVPQPLAPPVSSAYKSLGYRLMSEVPGLSSITYGNYGGPGYTAGSRDPSKWAVNKNGRYIVPPIDEEDSIYKMHDEAILAARGDHSKETAADEELYIALNTYSRKADLSAFGRAARMYFAPKMPRDKEEL